MNEKPFRHASKSTLKDAFEHEQYHQGITNDEAVTTPGVSSHRPAKPEVSPSEEEIARYKITPAGSQKIIGQQAIADARERIAKAKDHKKIHSS